MAVVVLDDTLTGPYTSPARRSSRGARFGDLAAASDSTIRRSPHVACSGHAGAEQGMAGAVDAVGSVGVGRCLQPVQPGAVPN